MNQKIAWLTLVGMSVGAASAYWWFVVRPQSREIPTWQDRDAKMTELQNTLKRKRSRIGFYQGDSRCTSDSQCRVLGLGSQICGHYRDYLIYSTKDAAESELLDAVAQFNQVFSELANLSLSAPGCGTPSSPVGCRSSKCVPLQ